MGYFQSAFILFLFFSFYNKLLQSDGEASVMLKLWGMRSNPLLPSLQGPFWPGVVALDRVLSMGQIELFEI